MNFVKKISSALFLMTFVGGQMPAYADGVSPQRAMTGEGTSMDVAGAASGGASGTDVPWWTVGLGAAALAAVIIVVSDDGKKVVDEEPEEGVPLPPIITGTGTSTGTGTN